MARKGRIYRRSAGIGARGSKSPQKVVMAEVVLNSSLTFPMRIDFVAAGEHARIVVTLFR
ncbi:MAG: hypothetical protein DWQ34_11590 [Planctomycetota bacterium]|nr:MAG: hypothetical protein DWQ29_19250 [Planctomycetota bacterium]REJ93105.1 MAG: hypothetical protein DWQ34_11590 [Planctomycetota bacterium]REK30093.1 MAG: hypothetical protein DWQ41_02895 [Planctomycetota bacterium]REK37665.1 MAG: hypothetical protein DWQ45_06630 [Planctomycetota bacterium]